MDLGKADAGTSHDVTVGSTIVICLSETPTTGYRWQASVSDATLLTPVDDAFTPGGNAPGAGGRRRLTFRAMAPGEATITLGLRRGWETAAAPLESLAYPFRIG